jgi:hypothetical protein
MRPWLSDVRRSRRDLTVTTRAVGPFGDGEFDGGRVSSLIWIGLG